MQIWLARGADPSKGAPWEPLKSTCREAEEAQGDEDLLSILSAPAGEWRPFEKQSSFWVSILESAVQRRDDFSCSEFWSCRADDRRAAAASVALRGKLQLLKNIWDSDDCSIFINPGVNVEEANLSDDLEYWILHEYAELVFLRAATASNRRRNLQSIFLWLEGRENIQAFDLEFEFMKDLNWMTYEK